MKHDDRCCFKNPHKKNQIRNEATRDRVSNFFCTSVRFFCGRIWEDEIEAFKRKAAAAVFQNRCKWTRFWNIRTSTSVARVSDNWAGIQLLSKKAIYQKRDKDIKRKSCFNSSQEKVLNTKYCSCRYFSSEELNWFIIFKGKQEHIFSNHCPNGSWFVGITITVTVFNSTYTISMFYI